MLHTKVKLRADKLSKQTHITQEIEEIIKKPPIKKKKKKKKKKEEAAQGQMDLVQNSTIPSKKT
jgi:hypothetical protein